MKSLGRCTNWMRRPHGSREGIPAFVTSTLLFLSSLDTSSGRDVVRGRLCKYASPFAPGKVGANQPAPSRLFLPWAECDHIKVTLTLWHSFLACTTHVGVPLFLLISFRLSYYPSTQSLLFYSYQVRLGKSNRYTKVLAKSP